MRSVCSVEGCGCPVKGHGFCNKHYLQFKKYGEAGKGQTHAPLEDRFWRYVDKSGDCWAWIGQKRAAKGYGQIGEGGRGGKNLLAHRVSYEIHHGPIPDGMVVMHKCDNPSCVNPDHLGIGTASENIKEAYTKGRKSTPFKQGEAHHGAVLNAEKVRFIRSHPEMRTAHLSRMLGCSRTAIDNVRQSKTWKHVT